MTEYLRVSGIYWGLTAMDLMGQLEVMNKSEVLQFVRSCQHPCGGIGACVNHDPHLLHTLSAVQVGTLIMYNMYVLCSVNCLIIISLNPVYITKVHEFHLHNFLV